MDDSAPRAATRSRRRGVISWFLASIGLVLALALVVGGFYVWRTWTSVNDIKRSALLPEDYEGRPDEDAAVAGSLNYVLMGSDSRGEDRGRSDVLMLAHVPPEHDKVYVVSFPRDMWVDIPGRGKDKINAAFAYGGEPLATRTLESLVGVRMDHAVKIDFEGFVGLTEHLGGVTVQNRIASSVGEYSWPKGEITIAGDEALRYVRQRYGLPNGDLDRAERQRAVVKAVITKLLRPETIANPATFNAVAGEVSTFFEADEELTPAVVFKAATSMRVDSGSDIVSLQAPITGFGRSPGGASIDVVDEAQLAEMAQAIRTGKMADYAEKYRDQPFVGRK